MNAMPTLIRPEDITDLDALSIEQKARIDWPEPLKTCCGKCGSKCQRRTYLAQINHP